MVKTTEQMIEEAKAKGIEIRISERPKGGGEIAPLPGVRREDEFDENAPERDDDGTGTDE